MELEAQDSKLEIQAALKQVNMQIRAKRKLLVQTRGGKGLLKAAIISLTNVMEMAYGEAKTKLKCKIATAINRTEHWISLENRLNDQIYKLKTKKQRLEKALERFETKCLNNNS